jgi:hypothetical protein
MARFVSLEPIDVRFPTSRLAVKFGVPVCLAPTTPGTSAEMHRQSVIDHRFPDGPVWRD